ncbi:hypothetical protein ACWIGL_03795 [Streptomyces albidoflavus]
MICARLTDKARKEGVLVKEEPTIFGSHKPNNADVAVIHPSNGVLISIGVRSQMISVGNNVLGHYQGIIGECISLQDRFPMAVFGYAYLHPVLSKKSVKVDPLVLRRPLRARRSTHRIAPAGFEPPRPEHVFQSGLVDADLQEQLLNGVLQRRRCTMR